jgi:hypothetical protein
MTLESGKFTPIESNLEDLQQYFNGLSDPEKHIIDHLSSLPTVDFEPTAFPEPENENMHAIKKVLGLSTSQLESLDYTIQPSRLNPDLSTLVLRFLKAIETETAQAHDNPDYVPKVIRFFDIGSIGSGKTYIATQLRYLMLHTNQRLMEKYNIGLDVHYGQWDETEEKLTKLDKVKNLQEFIQTVIDTSEIYGYPLSQYYVDSLQNILDAADSYQKEPFPDTEPFPESYMKATDHALQLDIALATHDAQKRHPSSEKKVSIILADAVSGTDFVVDFNLYDSVKRHKLCTLLGIEDQVKTVRELKKYLSTHAARQPLRVHDYAFSDSTDPIAIDIIYDPDTEEAVLTVNTRTYFGTGAYLTLKRFGYNQIVDPKQVIDFGLVAKSDSPYLLTAMRMALMIAKNTKEASLVFKYFGIDKKVTAQELKNLQRGGHFSHLTYALHKERLAVVAALNLDFPPLPKFTHNIIRYIEKYDNLPLPEELTFSTRRIPRKVRAIANTLARFRASMLEDLFYDVYRRSAKHQMVNYAISTTVAHRLVETFALSNLPTSNFAIINNTPIKILKYALKHEQHTRHINNVLKRVKQPEDLDKLHDELFDYLYKHESSLS